jgi:1,2-phenylacetyl-CoA epoxidase PaaB subunit
MRFKFLIIPTALIVQVAAAQNPAPLTPAQGTVTTPPAVASSTPVMPPVPETPPASPTSTQTTYLDYKSVYEAATVEEEVKMATERFGLTPAQQDMWLVAATDRRAVETPAREKLDSKASSYEKDGVYRGLRTSQNTFYETIIGYLTPAQKQAFETDRLVLEEKRKRVAKLPPPPPPPAPTVTVAPVDSSAIKETEKAKGKEAAKKSKKKKKPVNQ